MRAVAIAAVVLAVPGAILAWAVAPILRANEGATLVLATMAVCGGVFVGWSLADAIGDGLAAWGAARGIASGGGAGGPVRDVLDLEARQADVALTRARAAQVAGTIQAPLAAPVFPAAVDDTTLWRVEP